MLKITGCRSWNMNADNLDEMVRFYREGLGAEEGRGHTVNGVQVAGLRLGSLSLGLFDASDGPRPGVPHHTFDFEGASDPNAAIKELETKGIKVDHIRVHGEGPGYSLYVDDPCGNHIELSTDPK